MKQGEIGRRELSGAYKDVCREVSAILFRHDPVGINFGGNTDEYDPEAGTIVGRLRAEMTIEEAVDAVHEAFVHWFGVGETGPKDRYAEIAAEVLMAYRRAQLR